MVTDNKFHWGVWMVLGVLLIISGFILLGTPAVTTVVSVVFLGVLMTLGGIFHLLFALFNRPYEHFWLHFLVAIMTLVVGVLILLNPTISLVTLTLMIALFLLTTGIFRFFGSLLLRYPRWGWTFVNGLISIILGILILMHWPAASYIVIGIFVGIDFIFTGWAMVILSLFMKAANVHKKSNVAV